MKKLFKKMLRPVWARVRPRLAVSVAPVVYENLHPQIQDLHKQVTNQLQVFEESIRALLSARLFVPRLDIHGNHMQLTPFMSYSTCSASDFFHPRYTELCKLLDLAPRFHRKEWEWTYIIHHLLEAGVLTEGKRGLGFGVGKEPLPAFFASLGASIVATDAPSDVVEATGWCETGQYSHSLDQLRNERIIPNSILEQRVVHQACDMNAIDSSLCGFDFTWSSCCFEHLGSLEAGMEFVINSVEKTLKVGGIACHTTEYNLSSNEETLTEGGTVIYRRRDILELIARLRARGHEVSELVVAPDAHYMDLHIDVPPYTLKPHLKLQLANYVATSVGIVVRRGR